MFVCELLSLARYFGARLSSRSRYSCAREYLVWRLFTSSWHCCLGSADKDDHHHPDHHHPNRVIITIIVIITIVCGRSRGSGDVRTRCLCWPQIASSSAQTTDTASFRCCWCRCCWWCCWCWCWCWCCCWPRTNSSSALTKDTASFRCQTTDQALQRWNNSCWCFSLPFWVCPLWTEVEPFFLWC